MAAVITPVFLATVKYFLAALVVQVFTAYVVAVCAIYPIIGYENWVRACNLRFLRLQWCAWISYLQLTL